MERKSKSDLTALKERAARHAKEFCTELFPDGRLSRTGGYWIVDDQDSRISLKSGYFWSIANYSKKPKGDILTLWLRVKGYLVKREIPKEEQPATTPIRNPAVSLLARLKNQGKESPRVQPEEGTSVGLAELKSRLSLVGRFGGYQFRDSESFRQGVESFIEWLDERFPVRSDLHEVIGWDS